jgi:hypothetical protein
VGYNVAGQTETRSSDGDQQALTRMWDGQVETITGFGENGAGAWVDDRGLESLARSRRPGCV